ncbi:MAG: AMIN domain-containing protein [Campylobacterota bacterium]|nr:AMIN domain-containing protein [Campylobacterota bacterium]
MIKFLILQCLLLFTLDARENPFFPSEGEKDITYSSNLTSSAKPLQTAKISLPPKARSIESVTLNYKNLDGSLESKTVQLNKAIDWHRPIYLSQKKRVIKKSFKKIASIRYATFLTLDKQLKVITKDRLIRNFLLVKPHRIVLDFKRDSYLKAYVKKNPKNIFKKIKVGNHQGYYRVVLELDGYYKYRFKKLSNGYIFTLR